MSAPTETGADETERTRDTLLALERQNGMKAIRIAGLEAMLAARTAERDELARRLAALS